MNNSKNRPTFPKRAVITAGMPYGNKELHFGHSMIFIMADTYARFLRDRLGYENVIFVSGTDCYGSPLLVAHQQLVNENKYSGSLEDFARENHKKQKEALSKYRIDINLFAASAFGEAKEIHEETCAEFFDTLYKNGHLQKLSSSQFFDITENKFLNGRQVLGRCPIAGCKSEKAYADECDLGHQYMPNELIAPLSVLSGEKPELKSVDNWYFDLPKFMDLLKEWNEKLNNTEGFRKLTVNTIDEFLKKPVIYIKKDDSETYNKLKTDLPPHKMITDEKKPSFEIIFDKLSDREAAFETLSKNGIRSRTGKTLVPFRLTGNVSWGVLAPDCDGTNDLTFWVWPESLFAPISFTKTYLKSIGKDDEEWKNWWQSTESIVYQFIGSDNISFYGPAEAGMWMGMQGENPVSNPQNGSLSLPYIVAYHHILFLDKKASSSGAVKPPMALELLDYYTPEQLRACYLGLGLGLKSVSFQPKPLNKNANENEADPVLKDGNLLTNVLNRIARSCFYTVQTYYENKIPYGCIDDEILENSHNTLMEYEKLMYCHEFHNVMSLIDVYVREANKYWVANMREADKTGDTNLRTKTLVNALQMLRTAMIMVHPIAPGGTEMILEYLNLDKSFFDWNNIFDTFFNFLKNKNNHEIKILPPKTDFYAKHPSQFE